MWWKAFWFRVASIITLLAVTFAFTGTMKIAIGISVVNAIISTLTYLAFEKWWPGTK